MKRRNSVLPAPGACTAVTIPVTGCHVDDVLYCTCTSRGSFTCICIYRCVLYMYTHTCICMYVMRMLA